MVKQWLKDKYQILLAHLKRPLGITVSTYMYNVENYCTYPRLSCLFAYTIAEILREIRKAGFTTPSPIQVCPAKISTACIHPSFCLSVHTQAVCLSVKTSILPFLKFLSFMFF